MCGKAPSCPPPSFPDSIFPAVLHQNGWDVCGVYGICMFRSLQVELRLVKLPPILCGRPGMAVCLLFLRLSGVVSSQAVGGGQVFNITAE